MNKKNIINKLRTIPGLLTFVRKMRYRMMIIETSYYNKYCLPRNLTRVREKIKNGEKINVFFIAWNVSMWKYHGLYTLLAQDSRFNVQIILCPSPDKGNATREKDLAEMKRVFGERGYSIYKKVQEDRKIRFDFDYELRKQIDILFPVQPYSPIHLMNSIKNYIICYSSYGFSSSKISRWNADTFLCNIAWKYFVENETILNETKNAVFNKAKNRVVVGYMFGDELISPLDKKEVWKDIGENRKRIIWAPHHSIEENSVYLKSSFLMLHEIMLDIANKYKDNIQIAFKPHPFLYDKLCDESVWGKERTNSYYKIWQELENTQLEIGDYTELFNTSDAILHDCGTFTIEYLYTKKPAMFLSETINDDESNGVVNEALKCYYKGISQNDIESFIESVVIDNQDTLMEKREVFRNKYLLPPDGKSASENAYNAIINSLMSC